VPVHDGQHPTLDRTSRSVAAALPRGRSAAMKTALATIVDEAIQGGVVQKAIDAKGLKGVNVAMK
jgi:polar amino acid transport system substrate-binding protein